jgi:pyruvate dehydrogenase E1 component subunit alpha
MAPKPDQHSASHEMRASCGAGLIELYRRMVLIRRFDEKLAALCERVSPANAMRSHAGEEAVAAGALSALSDSDYVVSTYRQHGHYLVRGGTLAAVAAELVGRALDAVQERGSHLFDLNRRFVGAFGEPRSGLAAAAGLALSCQIRGEPAAVCCLFGDAALAEDSFHESLSLASAWNLPIVFVCENNFCGLGTQFDGPDCQEALYKFAESHDIAAVRVDGTEVLEVYRATAQALARARSGGGAALVDAVTYRLRAEANFDRGAAANLHHPGFWRQHDPIGIARGAILAENKLSDEELGELERSIESEIDGAIAAALGPGSPVNDNPARLARDRD